MNTEPAVVLHLLPEELKQLVFMESFGNHHHFLMVLDDRYRSHSTFIDADVKFCRQDCRQEDFRYSPSLNDPLAGFCEIPIGLGL
jgi:hypothetical protein